MQHFRRAGNYTNLRLSFVIQTAPKYTLIKWRILRIKIVKQFAPEESFIQIWMCGCSESSNSIHRCKCMLRLSVVAMQTKWKNGLIYDYDVVVCFVVFLFCCCYPPLHWWLFCFYFSLKKGKCIKWKMSFHLISISSVMYFHLHLWLDINWMST